MRWYDRYEDLTGIKYLLGGVVGDEHAGCLHAVMDS